MASVKQSQNINLTINNYVNINYISPYDSGLKKEFRASYPHSEPTNLGKKEAVKRTLSQLENYKTIDDLHDLKKSPALEQPQTVTQRLVEPCEEPLAKGERISKGLVEERVVYDRDISEIIGFFLLFTSFVVFFCFTFLFTSSFLFEAASFSDSKNQQIYYSFLIPLMIPVSFVAVYVNWVAMKFFRHC